MLKLYSEVGYGRIYRARVEAGLNTSIVALQIVGGDEKEPRAWGYNCDTLFLENINKGTRPSRQIVVKSTTGFGLENDCAGEDQQL
jgi:hypothetical protein